MFQHINICEFICVNLCTFLYQSAFIQHSKMIYALPVPENPQSPSSLPPPRLTPPRTTDMSLSILAGTKAQSCPMVWPPGPFGKKDDIFEALRTVTAKPRDCKVAFGFRKYLIAPVLIWPFSWGLWDSDTPSNQSKRSSRKSEWAGSNPSRFMLFCLFPRWLEIGKFGEWFGVYKLVLVLFKTGYLPPFLVLIIRMLRRQD